MWSGTLVSLVFGSIGIVVGIGVSLGRQLIHLRVDLVETGILQLCQLLLGRFLSERLLLVDHGIACESLLKLGRLRVESIIKSPLFAHVNQLVTTDCSCTDEAR